MADVIIIGDGPGGLSAALFLAKKGKDVVVFGEDKTAMHAAMLHNYLGIDTITGTEFQEIARAQATKHGATLRDDAVEQLSQGDAGFTVTSAKGATLSAPVLVLSEGKGPRLARAIGLEPDAKGAVPTDANGLTSIAGVYVVGRSRRPGRSQAIISAGDGAAAALDILSREAGQDVCDWDTPPES
jgi:thioredoxin reductase